MRHTIWTAHELHDVARADRAVGAHVGAHVGMHLAAQADDGAVALAGDLQVSLGLAGMVHRHQVLAAVLDPLHRAVDVARRERDQEVLRVELAARTVAAADIVLDHLDGRFRQLDHFRQDAAVEERHLGRARHRETALGRIPFGHDAARLHGQPVVPPGAERLAPGVGRLGERGVGVALAGIKGERAIGARRLKQQTLVLRRHVPVGKSRQILDLDGDVLQRILTDRDAGSEHHGKRLANVSHLVVGDHRLLERLELRQRLEPHGDDRWAAGHILRRDDAVHALDLQCCRSVDRLDAAVRHRAAQDHGVEQIRGSKIVDIGATPAQEAQILAPFHRRADERVLHRVPSFL